MLDSKLFVSRFDDPFPNLYERWWDGDEWIWLNHSRPGGMRMATAPGAAMLTDQLFVVVEDGSLWERHRRADTGQWDWQEHGRPGNRPIVHAPGAAMMNEKLFVVVDDGRLWERHWRADLGRWAWQDHGRPPGVNVSTAPGAEMQDRRLFVGASDGSLWERGWNGTQWEWISHGKPPGTDVATAAGAAMLNAKFFVGTRDGRLFERYFNPRGQWVWVDHGRPPGTDVGTAPGAAMMGSKFFVGTRDGRLFERYFNPRGQWVWVDHGRPPGTDVGTAPGAAMMGSKLFVGTRNRHLFERLWSDRQGRWVWVDHGTACQDQAQYVVGAPGPQPRLTIAVMSDGYAEDDLDNYRRVVEHGVLRALTSDQLAGNTNLLRVIRIDVVSRVSGVTERHYDVRGTVDRSDDVLNREDFRPSRLGVIATGEWNRGWFEFSDLTGPRIEKLRRLFAPGADHVVVVVNTGMMGGLSSIGPGHAFFDRGTSWQVIAHELGHNLFALGDEYHQDDQTFTGAASSANLSEQPPSWEQLKWRPLVTAGAPLPTDPGRLPGGWNRQTSVGALEGGGGGFARGIFRPVLECRMNQNYPPWCPVCAREIDRQLAIYR